MKDVWKFARWSSGLSMDLPVDEWKSYVLKKWSLLPLSIQVTVSTAKSLSAIFLQCSSHLQPEDEIFLKRLSSSYLVEKDPDAPLFYREEGNRKFQRKDYKGATVLYSKGISHSRPNTEDISLCYANRSAALFHLGQYEVCLKDIIRAQIHGYPERLQPKMMLRKAECLVALGRLQEANQSIGSRESVITDSRQVRLATGLFPVVSLLNHSCSPNTSVAFINTAATVQASQQIVKGQEILHCYGPHESRMDVAERQQKLRSQYFFECNCPACQNEKHRTTARPRWEAFCCNSCRATMQGDDVLSCGSRSCTESVSRDHLVSRLQGLQRQVGVAQKLLRSGKLEQAIQQLLECQRDAESFLSAEHIVVGRIEDDLAQAYAALGDWGMSATHLQKSLRMVEVRHGPSSIEMGHELFKLAQVFFNGFAIPEALNTIQKAEKVLSVHYGPWNDEIQELQKMKSCLLDLPPIPVGPSV
ncbi:protein-lysine N-methyltransferase SMYD4 isoform X7 [Tamandua tetradactyla]|uniref:protein-lysine N-methyltransferase SMYD4 isoform X7 n=1 Tax=Tamandua tetradactyla TaxID=48850 RepID=UPI004053E9B1